MQGVFVPLENIFSLVLAFTHAFTKLEKEINLLQVAEESGERARATCRAVRHTMKSPKGPCQCHDLRRVVCFSFSTALRLLNEARMDATMRFSVKK